MHFFFWFIFAQIHLINQNRVQAQYANPNKTKQQQQISGVHENRNIFDFWLIVIKMNWLLRLLSTEDNVGKFICERCRKTLIQFVCANALCSPLLQCLAATYRCILASSLIRLHHQRRWIAFSIRINLLGRHSHRCRQLPFCGGCRLSLCVCVLGQN